uniref:Uncharacterized protein n=1 Tax=Pithovirus LCPAC401 TaxID=2506595 RepID=A0A481ZB61_9VIRU|nr:MAG: uncharacterized protein LCPAC401_03330 [Pithovirus LCPAC401]
MAGSYAITNGKNIPWYEQPYVAQKSKKNNKKKKVIIHPLFQKCETIVEDPFWKEIFIKMSMNKLPKGFRITENKLICHDRNKSQYIPLIGSISEIAAKVMQFLREKANILSQIDRSEIRDSYLSIHKEVNEPRSWNQIRLKPGEKRAAIIQFASEKASEYNLSNGQFDDLLTLINLNLYLGRLDNDDIDYREGYITEIKGIIVENNKFRLDERRLSKRCKYKDKDLLSINLRVRPVCTISSAWAKIAASRSGKTKMKIMKEITLARGSTGDSI